jgi:hypothetical protein
MKRTFKWIDKQFNKFIQMAGSKPFLEYTVKYFLSVGIGMHLIGLFVVIIYIVT